MAFPLSDEEHQAIKARIDALPELIVAVAVRTPYGTITKDRPARHGDLWRLLPKGMSPSDDDCEHGFLTSHGRFVGREEAATIVVEADQGSPRYWDGYTPRLFTEDMWNNEPDSPPPHQRAE